MAKKSSIERNEKRRHLVKRFARKRAALKKRAGDASLSMEERFEARQALTCLPPNSSPSRVKNRCAVTGRSHAYYRDFGISRIILREWAVNAKIPGLVKASW